MRIQISFGKSWQLLTKPPLLRLKDWKEIKWFNGEVLEKLNSRDKLLQKFKKSWTSHWQRVTKKSKYEALELIATKKQAFLGQKISESIGKPKELWESLKYLGMPNKTVISNLNAMEDNDTLTYDTRSIATVFKNFF